MKYVLDTDHISLLQRNQSPERLSILSNMGKHSQDEILTNIVSFHEQVLGCNTYISQAKSMPVLTHGYKLLAEVIDSFTSYPVLPLDLAAAGVLSQLVASRVRLKAMDLRIAAIALSVGGVLVTRNVRDFSRVPGLQFEDWSR